LGFTTTCSGGFSGVGSTGFKAGLEAQPQNPATRLIVQKYQQAILDGFYFYHLNLPVDLFFENLFFQ